MTSIALATVGTAAAAQAAAASKPTWSAVASYATPVASVLAAIAVALATVRLCQYARRTLLYYVLADVQRTYRSAEMLGAVTAMWAFQKSNPADFVDRYISVLREDEQWLKGLSRQSRPAAVGATLHHQRRIVSQFYHHLGVLCINGLIPRKILYSIWGEEDLRIIPKVLVPIENRLREVFTGTVVGPLDDKTPMVVLYSRARAKR